MRGGEGGGAGGGGGRLRGGGDVFEDCLVPSCRPLGLFGLRML